MAPCDDMEILIIEDKTQTVNLSVWILRFYSLFIFIRPLKKIGRKKTVQRTARYTKAQTIYSLVHFLIRFYFI